MLRLALLALVSVACLTACGSSGSNEAGGSRTKNGPVVVAGYASLGGIHLRDVHGSLHALTTNEHDAFPTWSPDGRRIAFERLFGDQGATHLFVMDRDGGGVHRIGNAIAYGEQFSWSPDGDELVYEGQGGLRTIGIDGSGDRLLYANRNARQPAWSPDGKTIAFYESAHGLKEVSADGGTAKMVAPVRELKTGHFYELANPAWSPDGDHLAYIDGDVVNFTTDYPNRLVIVNPDGGGRRIVAKIGPNAGPSSVRLTWSPDGTQIAFFDHRGDKFGIWTVSAAGGKPKLLLDDYHYSMPSWGPAGT